ncbi:MAG: NADPH-dependent FMN reductase [Brevundimonas sp.]|uniref:NADPH-dependent FMN reductase n=1 Tax=Brevundimonas sp. TaxID=1871086 RepID=UPI00391CCD8F
MADVLKVAVAVGSTRAGSINQSLAGALARLARGRLDFDLLPMRALPLYDGDLEVSPPDPLWDFKARIEAADGVLFVSPEHNRSVTALMKNAIDWASRPAGRNSWLGKRAAVCGGSPGTRGADMSQMHLRQIVVALGVEMMPQPEAYLQLGEDAFTPEGGFADPTVQRRQALFVEAFDAWLRR